MAIKQLITGLTDSQGEEYYFVSQTPPGINNDAAGSSSIDGISMTNGRSSDETLSYRDPSGARNRMSSLPMTR